MHHSDTLLSSLSFALDSCLFLHCHSASILLHTTKCCLLQIPSVLLCTCSGILKYIIRWHQGLVRGLTQTRKPLLPHPFPWRVKILFQLLGGKLKFQHIEENKDPAMTCRVTYFLVSSYQHRCEMKHECNFLNSPWSYLLESLVSIFVCHSSESLCTNWNLFDKILNQY